MLVFFQEVNVTLLGDELEELQRAGVSQTGKLRNGGYNVGCREIPVLPLLSVKPAEAEGLKASLGYIPIFLRISWVT